ncbi:MAG: DHH family phosphoesterase, partial [Woeseiaceae bacterium]
MLARVMAARGVQADEATGFLEPSLKLLMPDPSGLVDMDAAVARVADAVQAGRKIAIFGDYDVDGATSSAIFAKYLQWLGLDPVIHIPDRIIEGYGPNGPAIEHLRHGGADLLVTLDCGSTSFEAFETARQLDLDVVVIDHHQVGETLPAVEALVNPNRQDDLSGQGHLAAVGVTFLFLVGLNRELRRRGV